MTGVKRDRGKPRWSLLPWGALASVVGVLEYGASKYDVDNWKRVENPRQRYFDAAMRHLLAWHMGEVHDPESGLPHLAHAVCCVLFLLWFDTEGSCE
jgi:hypothetical protein